MDIWSWFLLVVACFILVVILAFLIVLAVKNKWIKDIYDTLAIAIKEAEEKFPKKGSGQQKQEYVLAAVRKKCEELKIPFTILELVVRKLIQTIINNYNVIAK